MCTHLGGRAEDARVIAGADFRHTCNDGGQGKQQGPVPTVGTVGGS